MMSGVEIVDRIETLIAERGETVTAATKKAGAGEGTLRSMRKRNSRGSVDTLIAFASYLGVSVSDLLGEVNAASGPDRTPRQDRPVLIVQAGAGAEFHERVGPGIGITLEDVSGGEAKYLLQEGAARIFFDRLSRGLDDLGATQTGRSESSVSS